MRLDQWLWAVRVYKTRSIAAAEIKKESVQVNGRAAKPSHVVRAGELIAARLGFGAQSWTRTLRVTGAPLSRVGAKLVEQFAEDLTPAEEFERRRISISEERDFAWRSPGTGRPTKRERRSTDALTEPDENPSGAEPS
jgi:ribosome-associated heat shock protein Hsp15